MKIASLGFGRRATQAQKAKVIQELRRKHDLAILLEIAQLPKATYCYCKNQNKMDKYAQTKAKIAIIFHGNKGRYGYRRVTDELGNRGIHFNHKTARRLMRELGLVYRVRMKKYRSYKGEQGKVADNELNRELRAERPNQKWVTDNRQIKTRLKGLPPALHKQQALSAA